MELNINFSGATISLTNRLNNIPILITGNGVLSSNYTINVSDTPTTNDTFTFYYKATVNKATYNFNILGTNLTDTQLNRESTIVAVYNGVSWNLNVQPNTKSTNWITVNDLQNQGGNEVLVVPVSFEASEQCSTYVYLPYSCYIRKMMFSCTKALAGTDNGLIHVDDSTYSTTIYDMTIPLSTPLNDQTIEPAVDYLFEIAGGDTNRWINLQTSKTTTGGKGVVSFVLERI
jgi:hypothetical protein